MKVHIINFSLSPYGGGIFTVIKELFSSKAFLSSKFKNLIFWGYDDDSISGHDSLPGPVNVYKTPFKRVNRIFFSNRLRFDLFGSVNSGDIIHLHSLWLYLSFLTLSLKSRKEVVKIISVHGMLDSWALKHGYLKKRLSLFLFERSNLNSADCLHALCEQEYNDIRQIAPYTPIAIIPNGIYLPVIPVVNRPCEGKTLLFLGRIHKKKGLTHLIKAWNMIDSFDWKLIIIGPNEDNHRAELEKLISQFDLFDSIIIEDPKFGEEKLSSFCNADAFILPSFSEGLPMTILEAWSYGLPVLMTPQCNLVEGFEVNAGIRIETNPESISIGLSKLFSMSDNERKKMGKNGFDLVKSKYTWDSVAKQMIELYDWTLGNIDKPSFIRLN